MNNNKNEIESTIEAYLQGYKDALAVIRIAVDIKAPSKEEMLKMLEEKIKAREE